MKFDLPEPFAPISTLIGPSGKFSIWLRLLKAFDRDTVECGHSEFLLWSVCLEGPDRPHLSSGQIVPQCPWSRLIETHSHS